jgi:16S rRNA (uracil1498-N3)-methyltransferase
VPARFHAPDVAAPGELMPLPAEESEHLARVLRLAAGAAVRVFDGRGHEFDAVVETIARGGVLLRIGRPAAAAPEPRLAVTLAQAILKGDKMDDIVRDAVMIGAASIQPIVTSRTEVSGAALDRGRRLDRWRRIAISSAKQCGRAIVPPIAERHSFAEAIGAVGALRLPSPALMLVEPGASAGAVPLRDLADEPPAEATVLIGPEGGWTPQEVEMGSGACRLVSLGGPTLRADAAPLIALAALFTRWQEF